MFKKVLTPILVASVLSLTLGLTACNRQTTLAKIGAVLVTGAGIYAAELNALLSQGAITQEQFDRLKPRADAILVHANNVAATVAKFPDVNRQNAAQIALSIGALVGDIDAALRDPDLVKVGPDAKAFKVLAYVRASANVAALTLAALFPPVPPAEPSAPESNRSIKSSAIKIELPKAPKGF